LSNCVVGHAHGTGGTTNETHESSGPHQGFLASRQHALAYVPTGFKGYGVKTRAVRGHEFGLDLSPEDKKALIAFLKTL
jgi:hypothetical protein